MKNDSNPDTIRFNYCYRDAGNYKNSGSVLFRNTERLSPAFIEEAIRHQLIDGRFFEHQKWEVPSLFFPIPNDDDHEWHEFIGIEETNEAATDERSASELVANYAETIEGHTASVQDCSKA
jgi:hypothetical protein